MSCRMTQQLPDKTRLSTLAGTTPEAPIKWLVKCHSPTKAFVSIRNGPSIPFIDAASVTSWYQLGEDPFGLEWGPKANVTLQPSRPRALQTYFVIASVAPICIFKSPPSLMSRRSLSLHLQIEWSIYSASEIILAPWVFSAFAR